MAEHLPTGRERQSRPEYAEIRLLQAARHQHIADAGLLDAAYAGARMPADVAEAFHICMTLESMARNRANALEHHLDNGTRLTPARAAEIGVTYRLASDACQPDANAAEA